MPNRAFRIGIDCRLAGQRHAGIGRYTQNLVRESLQLPNQFHWVLFFSDQEQADQVLGQLKQKYTSKLTVVLAPYRHYSFNEQLQMPRLIHAQNLDLLHVPHFNIPLFYTGKVVVTIHDLLWHEYKGADVTTLPMWQYWPKYLMYRLTVGAAVKHAQKILVPAQTVADQVIRYYPQTKPKIVITPEGVEPQFFTHQVSAKPEKYFVYLGSLYPHKNVKVVIQALKKLPTFTLKIVTSRSVFQQQLKQAVIKEDLIKQVEFLGYQTDNQVADLLQHATALVQPSLSEGFGLTGLEAMAAGTPVIASDIPIFREVYQDHATYFDAHSPKSFVEAATAVQTTNREQSIKAARQFVQKYQWTTMAKQTVAVYETILN